MNQPDPFPIYQPDANIARRKGETPEPTIKVDKPINMKFRVTHRPATQTKHYRRKKRTVPQHDKRDRTFY